MKLAEALVERKAAQEKFDQLRYRLKRSIFAQEGEEPFENPEYLLNEIEKVAQELESLIIAINHTNSQTTLDSGATITATIAQRDMLLQRISIFDTVLGETNQVHYRVRGSEIKLLQKKR